MSANIKHILEQGPVLQGLGRTAIAAIKQTLDKGPSGSPPPTPGPELTATLPPRSRALVADYVRHVGGNPRAYRESLPAHLFPQWTFGLASQTLTSVPYPLMRVMNGGCSVRVNAPIPHGEPINVSVRLQNIDDNGRRAVLEQRIITGTESAPKALEATFYAIVPLGGGKPKGAKKAGAKRSKPRVPEDATEIAWWRIGATAGRDFAILTGDFNPVHWIGGYARMNGFKNVILHGFSTMARAWEGLLQKRLKGTASITRFDVRFTRPLVLPAKVGLYIHDNQIAVGDAPGGPAYMVGTFETEGASE